MVKRREPANTPPPSPANSEGEDAHAPAQESPSPALTQEEASPVGLSVIRDVTDLAEILTPVPDISNSAFTTDSNLSGDLPLPTAGDSAPGSEGECEQLAIHDDASCLSARSGSDGADDSESTSSSSSDSSTTTSSSLSSFSGLLGASAAVVLDSRLAACHKTAAGSKDTIFLLKYKELLRKTQGEGDAGSAVTKSSEDVATFLGRSVCGTSRMFVPLMM